jgi:hypothetical protein
MTSGIEIAGLALGAFPLLLEGLRLYFDGAKKAKNIWFWKRNLDKVVLVLETESALFRNTCLSLLETHGYTGQVEDLMGGDII